MIIDVNLSSAEGENVEIYCKYINVNIHIDILQNLLKADLCLPQQCQGGDRGKRLEADQELIISDNLILNQVTILSI